MASTVKEVSTFDESERSSALTMPKRISLTRHWRWPKVILVLFVLEIGPTIAALALYGIADPDLYRTRLWQDGYANGFNSSPSQMLIAYANHKTPPTTPLVWSQHITTYNLVISILSTFILIVKPVLFIMHIWLPLLSSVIHAALAALYLYSTYAQLSPDTSDPLHPNPGAPWYITHSCSVAHSRSNQGYCKQAKASVAVAIILIVIFLIQLGLSIHSSIPSAFERLSRAQDEETLPATSQTVHPIYGPQTPLPYPATQKADFVAAHPLRSNQPPQQAVGAETREVAEKKKGKKGPREIWASFGRKERKEEVGARGWQERYLKQAQ
ncbi:hypothetical protein K461DRAFT_318631 [Myriangium duriaei CBS 260.36]|uniref:MARVEL domain-containing protein n=1 Tax=Myriangium duriaei CBS 260.36 TaxID=1168546 RepID=A0A9P4J8E0_9PEZI|nr:hypothetical protein K461DRAFT_318631 [Myriangium duriaei CBS 260.36]